VKYFLDTEFIEDGKTIEVLSVALVAENNREFYAVNSDANHARANDWVKANVLPRLYDDIGVCCPLLRVCHSLIGHGVLEFIDPDPKPVFWGYYADYDWVAFCQLFGTMTNLPAGFPMYCRDITQLCDSLGNPRLPVCPGEHHALVDARWNKKAYEFLHSLARDKIHDAIAKSTTAQLLADILNMGDE